MKKTLRIIFVVLIIVVAIALGFYFGQNRGEKQGEQRVEEKLGALIGRAYPKPPEVMHALRGIVRAVYGGTIEVMVVDPDDYLPHTDGSPYTKEKRYAMISSKTNIVRVDHTNPNTDGFPTITKLALSDLKTGDEVRIISNENIRDAEKFDVTRVEVIKY